MSQKLFSSTLSSLQVNYLNLVYIPLTFLTHCPTPSFCLPSPPSLPPVLPAYLLCPLPLSFPTASPQNISNMVAQLEFLEKQLKKLKDSTMADSVTSDLYVVRDTLTSPANLRVFMATEVNKLTTPLEPWELFVQEARFALSLTPSSLPLPLSPFASLPSLSLP